MYDSETKEQSKDYSRNIQDLSGENPNARIHNEIDASMFWNKGLIVFIDYL